MNARELAQRLPQQFGDALISTPIEFRGELSVQLNDPERITDVCAFARAQLGFDLLLDIASIDNYGQDPRWTLVYELCSLKHRCHLRLRTDVSESASELPTVSSIWPAANWQEREVFDLMGLRFRGHPDLRRILMWNGYPHHPLRKDFPLAGKSTDAPAVAFTRPAPLEGGPFVTLPGGKDTIAREPRARTPEP